MTPTVQIKTKTKCLKGLRMQIFGKQRVDAYQTSHSEQSTGQFFVGQPDEKKPGGARIDLDSPDFSLAT